MEHRFTPSKYYTTLGPHEPVLHVGDGDTIITTTVDARGFDQHREQVTPRGNPQTGPFFVEGAHEVVDRNHLRFVFNWFDELGELVHAGGRP